MAANPTDAEARLWEILEPLGFRCQEPYEGVTKNLGHWSYILDFFHWGHNLCVEVDGSCHRKRKGRDRRRDTRLRGEGITTLRLSNNQVLKKPREARAAILLCLGREQC